jgi:hypothetical protein
MTINVVDEDQTHCHCGWALPKSPVPVEPRPGEPIDRLVLPEVAIVFGCPQCECRHLMPPFKAEHLALVRAADMAVQ